MEFINFSDEFNRWSLQKVFNIVSLIFSWCNSNGLTDVELQRVEDNSISDSNNERVDVEICYRDMEGYHTRQKLLILRGKVLDGETFHRNFSKYYPEKTKNLLEEGKVEK